MLPSNLDALHITGISGHDIKTFLDPFSDPDFYDHSGLSHTYWLASLCSLKHVLITICVVDISELEFDAVNSLLGLIGRKLWVIEGISLQVYRLPLGDETCSKLLVDRNGVCEEVPEMQYTVDD